MPDPAFECTVETVRGRMSEEQADELFRFWSSHGALHGEAARERLPEVTCIARGEEGRIAGVNSVYAQEVPLIGGRRFWVYRSFLAPAASSAAPAMINAAFAALERELEPGGPVGLCFPVADRAEMERRPEPIWQDTELMYAGYTPDGVQVRVRYFFDAQVGPALPNTPNAAEVRDRDYSLDDRYRVEPFAGAESPVAEKVMELWRREGAMPESEARQRVGEVIAVVRERDEGVVAVSSAYLRHNEQLRMDLWYGRVFVAAAHRGLGMAVAIARAGRELLDERFTSGEDTRAAGMLFEVESDILRRYYNRALWPPTDFTFIGENPRGDHVRIHYFPGARVPLPT